jgi:hypothetical protein
VGFGVLVTGGGVEVAGCVGAEVVGGVVGLLVAGGVLFGACVGACETVWLGASVGSLAAVAVGSLSAVSVTLGVSLTTSDVDSTEAVGVLLFAVGAPFVEQAAIAANSRIIVSKIAVRFISVSSDLILQSNYTRKSTNNQRYFANERRRRVLVLPAAVRAGVKAPMP